MSIWDRKIHLHHFLTGPNLFGPCSGVLASLTLPSPLATWLSEDPTNEARSEWDFFCEAVLGIVIHAKTPASGEPIETSRWVHLLLALNDALRADYSIVCASARLLELSSKRLMVFVPCDEPALGVRSSELSAVMLFDALAHSPEAETLIWQVPQHDSWTPYWRAQVRTWREWAETVALNVNARWVAREAIDQGIPHYRLPGSNSLLQLGQGVHQRRLHGAVTDAINHVAFEWSQDKWQASRMFVNHGLPTTHPSLVSNIEQARAKAKQLGWPVVIKPRSTNKGVGVTVQIQDEETLRIAFDEAVRCRTGVLIEKHVPGIDHRLLVVGERFVAAAQRRPASIQGDGKKSIAELVDALNLARFQVKAPGVYLPLVRVELDREVLRVINAAGYGPDDIPPAGAIVPLRSQANLSTGGVSEDITASVHPDNRALAEHAAHLIRLRTAGVDFQTTDITRSWREVGGAILEINAGPALWVHVPRTADYDIPKAVLSDLFPSTATSRVLTAGITGSLGKTTTCRMLARILEQHGHTVALTTTQGAWIGKRQCRMGDVAGGGMAVAMLQDASVTASVAELARGGLLKRGLGLDTLDVGAVLNVLDNHLGLDGVHSREQMARVKQLVVRHARHLAVLNADDPLCLSMSREIATHKLCLVGAAMTPPLAAHLQAGGLIAQLRESTNGPLLSLQHGDAVIGDMPMTDIPATWGGTFRPSMINALFATALAYGLGMPFATIQKALSQFASNHIDNPGRMNRIEGLPFELWISWADGPQAMAELGTFIANRGGSISKSLVFYTVGNRSDDFIRASAKAVVGTFDFYYCTDMEEDRRGRPVGEIASLLSNSLHRYGIPEERIIVEPSTAKAVLTALRSTPAGGTLVIGSYHLDKVIGSIRELWPNISLG